MHAPPVPQDGDVIGFGGPDTILARQVQVANPFIFKFYGSQEAAEAADEASYSTQEDHPMADQQVRMRVDLPALTRTQTRQFLSTYFMSPTAARLQ